MTEDLNNLERYCGSDDVAIVTALVRSALKRHCYVSVHDGEEWVVSRAENAEDILNAMGSTGEDMLLVRSPLSSENTAKFWLVYGNGDGTTISDHTDNTLANDIYSDVEPVVDKHAN